MIYYIGRKKASSLQFLFFCSKEHSPQTFGTGFIKKKTKKKHLKLLINGWVGGQRRLMPFSTTCRKSLTNVIT